MLFEESKKEIPDKWFYILIGLLGVFFIIKLIENAQIIWQFPLDMNHDIPSYMALLFLIKHYGFSSSISVWYNGLISLTTYPPGWFYLTLPIYYLFNHLELATYISFILMYLFGFIAIWFLGKVQKISVIKRVSFFILLFGNPLSLSYYLRLGRPGELLGWVIFIFFFLLLLYYKGLKLDFKFYLLYVLIYSALILSYFTPVIITSVLLLSFLIIKKGLKDKLVFLGAILSSLLLTSFWWIPFLKNISKSYGGAYIPLQWLILNDPNLIADKILTIITPLFFITIFILYWLDNKRSKKELLFYFPSLLLAVLLLTRLLVFVPIFNRAYPDSYNTFFIFLSVFLFLKIHITIYPRFIQKMTLLALTLIPILFIIISLIYISPYVNHTAVDEDIISLLPQVQDKLLILTTNERHLHAYATIYYNITTPSGASSVLGQKEIVLKLRSLYAHLQKKECNILVNKLLELNAKEVITFDEHCTTLVQCGLKKKIQNGHACLFTLS